MSRLAGIAMLLACGVGVGLPTSSEAGVIPWTYDAVFGPVGSMHQARYAPYYAGGSGYVGGNYLPASYSYGYPTNGCSSCQQSSYYGNSSSSCGCSPCGSNCGSSCSGGGCASGNCTTNSAPSGGLNPIADPGNYSRGIESRLDAIEKKLDIVPPREHTSPPRRTYGTDDGFGPSRPRPRSGESLDEGSAVPARSGVDTARPRRATGDVIEADENFTTPSKRAPAHGKGTETELFTPNSDPRSNSGEASNGQRDTFKATTEKATTEKVEADSTEGPKPADADLTIPAKKPAPTGEAVDESNKARSLRLDSRITSKAVSPRERLPITIGFQQALAAKKKVSAPSATSYWAGTSRTADLAQHR